MYPLKPAEARLASISNKKPAFAKLWLVKAGRLYGSSNQLLADLTKIQEFINELEYSPVKTVI